MPTPDPDQLFQNDRNVVNTRISAVLAKIDDGADYNFLFTSFGAELVYQ
jgi:hypothetical protein